MPAGGRLRAVSGDEHIRLDDPVPVDVGPYRALAAAEVREHRTPMVAVGGEGVDERTIDRLPRGELLGRALHLAVTAFGAEIPTHPAPRRWQGVRPVGPQQVDQFALDNDASAARLHRAGDALVDLHIEARPPQGETCTQAADGTARDSDPQRSLSA